MHDYFRKWADDSSELLSPEFEGIFSGSFSINSIEHKSVKDFLDSEHCDPVIVKAALRECMKECTEVLERQMSDFLTGPFSSPDPETDEVLRNFPLTNLVGESAFGDLDQDFNVRQNYSIAKRSASHCVKRNSSAGSFLGMKCKTEKDKLFAVARRRAREYQEEQKYYEKEVSLNVKRKMLENQEAKMNKLINATNRNAQLLKRLDDKTICETSEDVDLLVGELRSQGKTEKEILEVLRD
ncbi:hypothetical protein RRG08_016745 [Elysia crispata]|uniref:Uncharacterized protein n=1 Tax=Elysia crispata TaxID=231223 RepID=A0AAE1DNZ8_9GAST|nr:hypothetical protein RRG08_016745 [Elysia crispata]